MLHEKQRRRARKIKYSTGKGFSGALDKVSIKVNGQTTELTDKTEIENACHKGNKDKFAQTIGTPAISGQLMNDLGFLGTSQACQQILQGNYNSTEEADNISKELIKELKRPPSVKNSPQAIIPTEAFREGWMKMREKTPAGGSDLHFGHMKACA